MAKVPFSSFVIFAEMRTGSNFLEANLNAIPGVKCHGEAFNPYFIGGEGKQEMLGVTIEQRGADPRSLLQAMKAQTPGLSGFRYFNDHDPRVFDIVVDDPAVAKVILTRNHLESFISWKIAMASDQWRLANTKHLKTVRPRFELDQFERRLEHLQHLQRRLLHRLQATGQTAFYIDYEDILDIDVLNGLAGFLGVEGRLKALDFRFKKQNPEAIEDKVSNPAEMREGLKKIDFFALDHTPNFEPRRAGAVAQYLASEVKPLLFLPVKSAPEARIRKWLNAMGPVTTGMDRQSLGNGVFVYARRPGLEVLVPAMSYRISGLPEITQRVDIAQRVPASLLEHALHFSQQVFPDEALFWFNWIGQWYLHVPDQLVTNTSAVPCDIHNRAGTSALIDLHSHARFSPFFSLTDDRDETGFRIYAVIGNLDKTPTISVRVGMYSHYFNIPAAKVFELPDGMVDIHEQEEIEHEDQ